MQVKYYTKNGSVYTQTVDGEQEFWAVTDKDGNLRSLSSAIHISLQRLQDLVNEYPSKLLDKTFCFDIGAETEFFEDAKREKFSGLMEAEDTVIFFLAKRAQGHYGLGSSSVVVRVEREE